MRHLRLVTAREASPYPVITKDLQSLLVARYLTRRESQCTHLATIGLSNVMIATEIGLLPKTVEKYLRQARQKLGVISRAQLIVYCLPYMGHCEPSLPPRVEGDALPRGEG